MKYTTPKKTCYAKCPALACGAFQGSLLVKDLVDDAVLDGFLRAHEEVAVYVALNLVELLTSVFGEDFVQLFAHLQNLLGGDFDVGRHTLGTA